MKKNKADLIKPELPVKEQESDSQKSKTKISPLILAVVIAVILIFLTANSIKQTDVNNQVLAIQKNVDSITNRLGETDKTVKILKVDLDETVTAVNAVNKNQTALNNLVTDLDKEVKSNGKAVKDLDTKVSKLDKIIAITPKAINHSQKVVKVKTIVNVPKVKVKAKKEVALGSNTRKNNSDTLSIAKRAEEIALSAKATAEKVEKIALSAEQKATSAITIATDANKKANNAIDMAGKVNVDLGKLVSDRCLSLSVNDDTTICDDK